MKMLTDRDDGDVEDKSISEKLLSVLLKHLSTVQESEIIGIWFAGISGFDLTTHDLYFRILVEVFMNHILAEKHISQII